MKRTTRLLFCTTGVLVLLARLSLAQVTLIQDDMNTDTSANYTIVNGGPGAPDGTLEFAYDYSTIGIPPAPGTTDGSTRGIRMSVNDTFVDGTFETEAYTLFHNTEIVGVTDYTMTIDMYLGVWAAGDTGSTESAQIGVGGDGVTRNHLFYFNGPNVELSGSGHFVAISGDGGDSSDYRHWRDNANGSGNPGPVNNFDPDYLSTDSNTNVNPDNFLFFEGISNIDAPIPGHPGNGWATVKVELLQSEGKIKYYVRGDTAATTGVPGANLPPEFIQIIESDIYDPEGFVNFGLADMYNSVATVPEDQFAIFDNLLVVGTEPMTTVDGDFNNDDQWDCLDIDALVAEVVAGTNNPAFDMNGDGSVNAADVTDAGTGWLAVGGANNVAVTGGNPFLVADGDLNGSSEVADFNIWNGNKFTSAPGWCSGDYNVDGVVDVGDFNAWNGTKFTSSSGVAAVPEPTISWMAVAVLFGWMPHVLRRRK